jgi:hypothetical protein
MAAMVLLFPWGRERERCCKTGTFRAIDRCQLPEVTRATAAVDDMHERLVGAILVKVSSECEQRPGAKEDSARPAVRSSGGLSWGWQLLKRLGAEQ